MIHPDQIPEIRCGVCQRSIDEVAFFHNSNGCQRCDRHVGRDPCAIDGCEHTRKATDHFYQDKAWICSEHWKIVCPPRSKTRQVYNRFWRIAAKLGGWDAKTPELVKLKRRFWRFWDALVKRGNRMLAGDIDQKQIDKMFGWDKNHDG